MSSVVGDDDNCYLHDHFEHQTLRIISLPVDGITLPRATAQLRQHVQALRQVPAVSFAALLLPSPLERTAGAGVVRVVIRHREDAKLEESPAVQELGRAVASIGTAPAERLPPTFATQTLSEVCTKVTMSPRFDVGSHAVLVPVAVAATSGNAKEAVRLFKKHFEEALKVDMPPVYLVAQDTTSKQHPLLVAVCVKLQPRHLTRTIRICCLAWHRSASLCHDVVGF